MRKRYVVLCALLVGSMLFAGCGNAATDMPENTQVSTDVANEAASDTVTGMIQSIEGSTVTFAVMNMQGGGAPEMPNGETQNMSNGEVPEKPEGEQPQMLSDNKMNSEMEVLTFSITTDTIITDAEGNVIEVEDLNNGSMVVVQMDEEGNAITVAISNMSAAMGAPNGMGVSGGMGQGAPDSYNALNAYAEDATVSGKNISSTGVDENAVLVNNGATVTLEQVTLERISADSTGGDSSSFYGIAAAIRSDRGGGTMTVDGGTYTSNGSGSPAVYCTADISIEDATLTATGSEAVCIEGLNNLVLTNCNLTGNMPDLSQNDCTWTVILYQSMSGDSEIGNSTFTMNGGSLTSNNGGLFYTTNTESTFYLSDVEITYADDCEFFLKCTGNQNQRGWGQSGANGADCIFTADSQEMSGNILWDSISTLDFNMQNGSILTGAFLQDESSVVNSGSGYANLFIDETSTWVVTENSTLSVLNCEGTIVDANGNSVTIQEADGTIYVKGTSACTITVTSYNK